MVLPCLEQSEKKFIACQDAWSGRVEQVGTLCAIVRTRAPSVKRYGIGSQDLILFLAPIAPLGDVIRDVWNANPGETGHDALTAPLSW